MSKSDYIEETLIKELKNRIMSFSDMTELLNMKYNEQSAVELVKLLKDIKQKQPLYEKIPGHYYISLARRSNEKKEKKLWLQTK